MRVVHKKSERIAGPGLKRDETDSKLYPIKYPMIHKRY